MISAEKFLERYPVKKEKTLNLGEGVETGRAAPKAFGQWRRDSPDHERHQTAAKVEVVRKSASL